MKLSTCCAALLLALASPAVLAAPGSCERIQSDISQRIINNGVPESSFTLSIVPNDQVDQPDSWICPYISRHLLSLNPLLACCRRYSRGER
ncbi:protein [Escherichia coli]|nr:protein [Escherichia coli]CAD5563647.1 protein [Escherichia coli]